MGASRQCKHASMAASYFALPTLLKSCWCRLQVTAAAVCSFSMKLIEVSTGYGGGLVQLKQADADMIEGLHSKAACLRRMQSSWHQQLAAWQVAWQIQGKMCSFMWHDVLQLLRCGPKSNNLQTFAMHARDGLCLSNM